MGNWGVLLKTHISSTLLSLLPQGYRNFYDRYRGDYERFYSRDYEYNRYRDYYRQYNRDVSIILGRLRVKGTGPAGWMSVVPLHRQPALALSDGVSLSSSGRITTTTTNRTETDTTGITTVTKGIGEAPAVFACQP
jgi:hypothetical protein